MSGQTWAEYAEAARELDAVRAAEAARTAGVRRAVAEMSEHADGLEQRLRDQGARLTGLSRALRFRVPKLTPVAPQETPDPAPGLSRIAAAIDLADREAVDAENRGRYPALLPRWSPFPRNLLIYGVAALGVLAAQIGAFYRDPESDPNPLLVLFLIPLVAYAVGYAMVGVAGRPRIDEGRVKLSPRLGLLLCFGIGPVAVAVLLVQNLTSR